jgi:hypothetical protein
MKIVERARLSCQQAAALFSEASGGATLHSSGTPRSPRLASPSDRSAKPEREPPYLHPL